MNTKAALLSLFLLLPGCTKVQNSSKQALDDVEVNTTSTWQKIREALDLSSRPPVKEKRHVQPRYCYKAFNDVICHSQPVPGAEERLVAYQNNSGTGYTIGPAAANMAKKSVGKTHKASKAVHPVGTIAKNESKPFTAEQLPKPVMNTPVYGPVPPSTTAAEPAAPVAPAPVAVAPTVSPKEAQKPVADTKKLKEITFDPSELEPKKLVPDRVQ
jgi:hypothetical protein